MAQSIGHSNPTSNGPYLHRVLVVAAVFTGVAVAGLLVVFAIDILLLVFAGVLFACVFGGVSRALADRTPLPYSAALAVVMVGLVATFAGAVAFLAPQVASQFAVLSKELTAASQDVYNRIRQSEFVDGLPSKVQELGTWLPDDFNAMTAIGGIFSTTAGALTGVAIILFIGFYLAADPSLYIRGFLSLIPPRRRERAQQILHMLGHTVLWWMFGRLVSMAIIGVMITAGLWLLRIPVPIALGVLAALLTFIPNVGPLLALFPPTLLALRESPTWAVVVAAFYIGVQVLEGYVITPLVQQRSISLPPAITLASQVILGFFTGIVGLALAAPLAAIGLVLTRELYVKDILDGHESATETKASS